MIVEFDQSFEKSIDRLRNKELKEKILKLILKLESVKSLSDISSLKEIKGHHSFFRIRMGDYRLGFEFIAPNKVLLILISHRKDIYKRFP